MRQFSARWWITDPLARWYAATELCASNDYTGLALRVRPLEEWPGLRLVRTMTREDFRREFPRAGEARG